MAGLRIAFGMAVCCLLAACLSDDYGRPQQRRDITQMSANEILAITSRVVDCEWAAVYRYDGAQRTVADLAEQIMGVCTVERIKAKLAVGLSPHDPQLEADDFKQAVEIVESARKAAPSVVSRVAVPDGPPQVSPKGQ
jgi:hypothetical protein